MAAAADARSRPGFDSASTGRCGGIPGKYLPHTSDIDGFHHEALFFAGAAEFVAGTVPFIRDGLTAGEPVLVAVSEPRTRLLQEALGADAAAVAFEEMEEMGRNPARIIPAWREFVDGAGANGRGARGVGEPAWPGRSAAELTECQHHESLLNLAFDGDSALRMLCPYDVEGLGRDMLEAARRTHPHLVEHGVNHESRAYVDPRQGPGPFEGPLPPAPADAMQISFFDSAQLRAIRSLVARRAEEAGLEPQRAMDLVLATNELTTNSLRHGGGEGLLRIWLEPDALVCEVSDAGRIEDLLVGRERPGPEQEDGRGVWLANQLCDLVQIRALPEGNRVRAQVRLDG